MKKKIALVLSAVFYMATSWAQKPDSLSGSWQIKTYHSSFTDGPTPLQDKGCADCLILNIDKKGKVKFIFTDKKDSVVFAGKIKFKKHDIIQIKSNIHENVYTGKLENCVTPQLREDLRRIFFRTFACAVSKDQLVFYYNLPTDLRHKKTMVLARHTS